MQRPVTRQSYGVEEEWDLALFQDLVRRGEVRKFTPLRLLVANLAFVAMVLLALIAYPLLRYLDRRPRPRRRIGPSLGQARSSGVKSRSIAERLAGS